MNIHTIKGTARTLHLQAIASASHDLEKEISHLRQKPDQMPQLLPLRDKLELVQSVINRYQAVSHEKLGWDMDEDNVRLPKRLVLECAHILAELPEPSRNIVSLEEALLRYCPSDLGHVILEASRGIDSIARDLNKTPPRIDVDAPNIMLTDPGSHLIQALFTHLIRNSLDHGLEDKAERAALGKPEQGTVRISAQIHDAMLTIRCQDDGRGLNLRKIRDTGERLGFISANAPLPPQETAELIFRSGLSTKEVVTEISGRGVGMDAVRSFVERVGGRVDISLQQPFASELKVPFALVLHLPQEFWWHKDARRSLTRSA